jgi:hypothetical protein
MFPASNKGVKKMEKTVMTERRIIMIAETTFRR